MTAREPWCDALPPRVQAAIRGADYAVTLKAGDMDGLSAVNLARDAKIIATELRRWVEGRASHSQKEPPETEAMRLLGGPSGPVETTGGKPVRSHRLRGASHSQSVPRP